MSTAIMTSEITPVAAPVSAHVASQAGITGLARVGTPRLRLTPRGRRVFTTLAALPLVIAALAFALNGGVATASSEGSTVAVDSVTVGPGQSLWDLAGEIAPDADPREVVSDLVSFNHLSTTALKPGQQLDVPNTYAS